MAIKEDWQRLNEFIEQADKKGDTRLPPEPKLSEELGISRGRLRTLLKRVEAEGLIWRHVGRGTFIGSRTSDAAGVDTHLSVSVDDVMDARMIIEPQLAAQAAIRATPADLQIMDRCLEAMGGAACFTDWKRLDGRLHRAVAEASHNIVLVLLYDTLRTRVTSGLDARIEQVFGAEMHRQADTDAQHREFVEAIRSHDPERSERLMREHLNAVRHKLFGRR